MFEGGGQGAPGAEVTREEEEAFYPLRDEIYLKYVVLTPCTTAAQQRLLSPAASPGGTELRGRGGEVR